MYMWVNRQHINGWNFMSFCQTVRHIHRLVLDGLLNLTAGIR